MKKTQKKLGNKGFSLVELIVVIAIMAVLVGVLAPTLIRNVEKSRESTDLQTLDSLRQSVTTALSTEAVNNKVTKGTSYTYKLDDIKGDTSTGDALTLEGALKAELIDDGVLDATMKSKSGLSGNITIDIAADGKVSVAVKKTSGEGADATTSVVTADRSKVPMEVK